MKFDMSRAWNEAVAIVQAHGGLLATVAGLFVFLPNLAFYVLSPETAAGPATQGDETPEQVGEIMQGYYLEALPWILGLAIVGLIGSLAMYALVTRARPTVGQALSEGVKALLPAIVAQIITGLALGLLGAILIGVPIALGVPALAIVTGIAFVVLAVYVVVKLSLVNPVIVIENVSNPIAALKRSWQLTKGNSLRLFGYFLILGVVLIVVASVFGLIAGLFVAMLGEGLAANLLAGILNGLLSAALAVLGIGILAAVHRQLAGDGTADVSETFA